MTYLVNGSLWEYNPTHTQSNKNGSVKVDRRIMSDHLGRRLEKNEIIGHLDGDDLNVEVGNLHLFSTSAAWEEYKTKSRSNRRCRECGEVKPVGDFYLTNKGRTPASICKPCNAIVHKRWGDKNRLRRNEIARYSQIKKKYGIDAATYKMMYANGCEVCGGFDGLAVDHDHNCCPGKITCGKCVRGVLCRRHNWAMANVNDNADEARKLAEYINKTRKIED